MGLNGLQVDPKLLFDIDRWVPSAHSDFLMMTHAYSAIFRLDILPILGSAVPCERVFSSSVETDAAH
jgi:hypothetical protein